MLVEGAQAKETLRNAPTMSAVQMPPMTARTTTIATTTDMPTYFITFK